MSDEILADKIRLAVDALNEDTKEAQKQGISVRLLIFDNLLHASIDRKEGENGVVRSLVEVRSISKEI